MSAFSVGICEIINNMSEFGKLRIPNTSSGAISAGVIIHELDLVNKLLARAGKAEAALESAQKMCDHWEAKAAERQGQVNEWKEKSKKLFDQYAQVRDALEKAEEERDEWKRRAGNAEFEVKRQRDLMNPVDWERVRIEAAIAAMQGMWASQRYNFGKPVSVLAVECADDLIAELQKKEVQG
jgi:hypothetical protein